MKDLTLRGIKLESFDFIRQKNLESLAVQWCGMNDLSSLNGFTSLKRLELWRIMKLEDISFISTLSSLESLRLLDLSHIHALPDLTGLENLKEIILDNVPIDETTLPERIRGIVSHH